MKLTSHELDKYIVHVDMDETPLLRPPPPGYVPPPDRSLHLLDEREIGGIGNREGGLFVGHKDGKRFWGIECDGDRDMADEIPEYLYAALMRYEDERKRSGG